jgi:hypothetical protein
MRRRPASRWILGRDPRLGQHAKPTDDALHREPRTQVGRVEHGFPHLPPRSGRHGPLPSPSKGARLHAFGVEGMLHGSGNGRACRPRSGIVRVADVWERKNALPPPHQQDQTSAEAGLSRSHEDPQRSKTPQPQASSRLPQDQRVLGGGRGRLGAGRSTALGLRRTLGRMSLDRRRRGRREVSRVRGDERFLRAFRRLRAVPIVGAGVPRGLATRGRLLTG